jgi:hypothetical protein
VGIRRRLAPTPSFLSFPFFFEEEEKSRRSCHLQADDFVDVHLLGTVLPYGILFLVYRLHIVLLYTIRLEIYSRFK